MSKASPTTARSPKVTTARIEFAMRGATATLTISNERRHNAMTLGMWRELGRLVRAVDSRDDVKAIIVTGAGHRAFCAGADISEFRALRHDAKTVMHYDATIASTERALANTRKPTVAIMRGICAGGGVIIALACDLRFAARDLRLSIPSGRLGAIYPASTVARLVQTVGPGAAFDLLASARVVTAAESLRLRLVDRIASRNSLWESAEAYVAELASQAPLSVRAAQLAVRVARDPRDRDSRRALTQIHRAAAASSDYREGIAAFLAGRPPAFTQLNSTKKPRTRRSVAPAMRTPR